MATENVQQSTAEAKPLKQLSVEIAKALGSDWTRSTKYDAEDSQEIGSLRDWRARLENSRTGEILFLSTTWGKKGMLYVGGMFPDAIDRNSVNLPQPASINVNPAKSAEQIARDITRRLLPEYNKQLDEVLHKHMADLTHKEGVSKTKYRVAEILGGLAKADSDIVYGHGKVDVQVCGPDSLRFSGHCLYLTCDQLERIRKAVPELFEKD